MRLVVGEEKTGRAGAGDDRAECARAGADREDVAKVGPKRESCWGQIVGERIAEPLARSKTRTASMFGVSVADAPKLAFAALSATTFMAVSPSPR